MALIVAVVVAVRFAEAPPAHAADAAGKILTAPPERPDPAQHYLFYLHGAWVETHGRRAFSKRYGVYYEYDKIVAALAKQGFVTISEARASGTRPPMYAQRIAEQVRSLLTKGVPPGHVTVAGHSKGGTIALIASSVLDESNIHYAVMAGCGKPGTSFGQHFQRFVNLRALQLTGRMLSIYDASDKVAGSCRAAFGAGRLLESKELVLATGRGHGVFYTPEKEWVAPLVKWAKAQ